MADRFLTKNLRGRKKGQGLLELTFVFISVSLLLGAVMHLWIWANNQVVQRQVHYNAGRVSAGTPSDTYRLQDHWPAYAPTDLREENVLIDAPALGGG